MFVHFKYLEILFSQDFKALAKRNRPSSESQSAAKAKTDSESETSESDEDVSIYSGFSLLR